MNNTAVLEQSSAPSRYTISFGISLAVTSILNALLVVLKERNQATVMAWMKKASGHHWASHTSFSLIVFFALGLVLAQTRNGHGPKVTATGLTRLIVIGVAIGAAIIFGFYLFLD
jgi:hypothetical protein